MYRKFILPSGLLLVTALFLVITIHDLEALKILNDTNEDIELAVSINYSIKTPSGLKERELCYLPQGENEYKNVVKGKVANYIIDDSLIEEMKDMKKRWGDHGDTIVLWEVFAEYTSLSLGSKNHRVKKRLGVNQNIEGFLNELAEEFKIQ